MAEDDFEDDFKDALRGPARVHIYGAGIAGLTAAHELARRGFRVRVHEPAQEYNELGKPEGFSMAVGGMARSQYLRAAKGALGNFPGDGQRTRSKHYRLPYDYTQDWLRDGLDPWRVDDFMKRRDLSTRGRFPGLILIHIPKPFDSGRTPTRRDAAKTLEDYLTWRSDPPRVTPERLILVDEYEQKFAEEMEAPFPPPDDKDQLLLEVVHYLPGEHGFRFFPSYYRHLFSTMVETPILDEQGNVTGRRVFDNLVPSSFYGIAAQGRSIRFLRRAPVTRPVEMLLELGDLASSGYPPSDALQFTLRMWRYMCTCSERRKAEYESISWWEYLEGRDPGTGTPRYQYSAAFKKDMQFAPRVLAAFDGAWGDARTNGNTLTQLYLNNLMPMPKTDGTLNGPTTPAWFRPWRRYLEEHLKVEFDNAWLTRLELQEDTLIAYVRSPVGSEDYPDTSVSYQFHENEPAYEDPVDYYIVATDAPAAERLTEGLPEIGVVAGLRRFTTWIPPNPRGSEPAQQRPVGVLPGREPWDRFQTLTGIQFFFPSSVRLAEGYLYFLDAPWGLSAINSQQYWAAQPTLVEDGFASVLSVDIGNWYVREPGLKSPSSSSRQEIAHEVWRQIREATEQHHPPPPHAVRYPSVLPEPAWYYLDRSIRFEMDKTTKKERPVENRAPYLIPILGDWERRPGPEPWDPMAPAPPPKPPERLPERLWQAPHGGYYVHWDKLVFAGTYLKTFTRMTTMESANESARHAVNAIIDHYLAHRGPRQEAARARVMPIVPDYGGQGTLTGSPDFRMTPIGEYCRIWNPERHELPELERLRELDAQLFAQGLPHVWDVLGLEPLVLPLLPLGSTEALKSLLSSVREALERPLSPLWPVLPWSPP